MTQGIVVNLHPYRIGGTRSDMSFARSRGRFKPTEMEIAKRQRLACRCKLRSHITQPMFARTRGVGLVALEWMPSGLPVIVSPRDGLDDIACGMEIYAGCTPWASAKPFFVPNPI
jgi:hypothetical protein